MKIKIELGIVEFMVVYRFLMETNEGINERPDDNLDFLIFQEGFESIGKQFSEQYTDEMGDVFERKYFARELIFKKNNN